MHACNEYYLLVYSLHDMHACLHLILLTQKYDYYDPRSILSRFAIFVYMMCVYLISNMLTSSWKLWCARIVKIKMNHNKYWVVAERSKYNTVISCLKSNYTTWLRVEHTTAILKLISLTRWSIKIKSVHVLWNNCIAEYSAQRRIIRIQEQWGYCTTSSADSITQELLPGGKRNTATVVIVR